MKRIALLAVATLALAALGLAGCGSSSGATKSAVTAATTATTRCFTAPDFSNCFCSNPAINWIHQGGAFRWAGAGYDYTNDVWLWQRPKNPNWPNVTITAHVGNDSDFNGCVEGTDPDPTANLSAAPPAGIAQLNKNWPQWPSSLEPRGTVEWANYRIQFHLNSFTSAAADGKLVAHIWGSVWSDCGLWAGLYMPGVASQVDGGVSSPTGIITNGMVGQAQDRCYTQNPPPPPSFPVQFLMSDGIYNSGGYFAPAFYHPMEGTGTPNTLFFCVNNDGFGNPQPNPVLTDGSSPPFLVDWQVTLQPAANQPAGMYKFDPQIVLIPAKH
jgi:hypothetical protein